MNSSNIVTNSSDSKQPKTINQLIDELRACTDEATRAHLLLQFHQACDAEEEEADRKQMAKEDQRARQVQAAAEARARQMQAEAERHQLMEYARQQLELIDQQRDQNLRKYENKPQADEKQNQKKAYLFRINANWTHVDPHIHTRVRFTNLDRIRVFSSESTPPPSSLAAGPAQIDLSSTDRLPSPPKSCLKRKKEEVTTEEESSEPSEKRSAP